MLALVHCIVTPKTVRDIFLSKCWSSDLLAFCTGIIYTGSHPGPDHTQFQFTKNSDELEKGHSHRIGIILAAVNGDTTQDMESDALRLDRLDDLAKLLHRAGQSGGAL